MAAVLGTLLLAFSSPLSAQDARTRLENECEVSSIKPVNPASNGRLGPSVYPGGRIFIGHATVKSLIELAYSVESFQISGGPDWIGHDIFDVLVLCPNAAAGTFIPSSGHSSNLNAQHRRILRDLLESRFNLKVGHSVVNGPGYFLVRGAGPMPISATVRPDDGPAMSIMQKGSIVDGEAFGINASMDDLAQEFQSDLQRIVVNKTGVAGSFDFHILPFDPENKDLEYAVVRIAKKLGLELKKGVVPQDFIKIQSVSRPDEN